jgi:hypothetical protein
MKLIGQCVCGELLTLDETKGLVRCATPNGCGATGDTTAACCFDAANRQFWAAKQANIVEWQVWTSD